MRLHARNVPPRLADLRLPPRPLPGPGHGCCRSLSALGDVFAALVAKNPNVPYTNSQLTHLLQVSRPARPWPAAVLPGPCDTSRTYAARGRGDTRPLLESKS